ncbi:14425_t:CDS:2 [Gigaspora margarita]|uniref:14425_t:CDS:1 n=1 Tax=Gigaspora margarita TaxID=4874 RepID=A0ABN7VA92_GIGMA|nr:14425_t:CDS:2 [Gigaspora margarita]
MYCGRFRSSSLNYHCSKINYTTWIEAGNNANAAEAAHAYANRSGKQLKLLSAINKSQKEMISNKRVKIELETNNQHELKIEEQKIILQERAIAIREKEVELRRKEAEIEALELDNKKMRNELDHIV